MEPETGNVLDETYPISGEFAQSRMHPFRADRLVELNCGRDSCLDSGIVGAEIPMVESVYVHRGLVERCKQWPGGIDPAFADDQHPVADRSTEPLVQAGDKKSQSSSRKLTGI